MASWRGPRGLAKVLPSVTKGWFRKRGFAEANVLLDWPDVVGAAVAARTCPERLDRAGTLRIRAAGAFGVELAHLEPLVRERINSYFGYEAVKRLLIVHGPVAAPRTRRTRSRQPMGEEDLAKIDRCLQETMDSDLRAALERLGRAILTRKP